MSYLHIQGGSLQRKKIWFNDKWSIRPTQAVLRETLFSWLNNNLHGLSCLDLFAGSGILSWEALSRGAEAIYLIEKNRRICSNLHKQLDALDNEHHSVKRRVALICADAIHWLKKGRCNRKMDIVFLDPPYSLNYMEQSLNLLHSNRDLPSPFIHSDTLIYYETDAHGMQKLERNGHFIFYRSRRRGQIYFGLLKAID